MLELTNILKCSETALATINQCVVIKGVPTADTKLLAGKQVEAAGWDRTRAFPGKNECEQQTGTVWRCSPGLAIGFGLAV